MDCPKEKKAYRMLVAASNKEMATNFITKFGFDLDSIPFEKLKDGTESGLYKALKKKGYSDIETVRYIMRTKLKTFKDRFGDVDKGTYQGKTDANGEIYASEVINYNESLIRIKETVLSPNNFIEGFNETELNQIINWAESQVLDGIFHQDLSEVALMNKIKQKIQASLPNTRKKLKAVNNVIPKVEAAAAEGIETKYDINQLRKYKDMLSKYETNILNILEPENFSRFQNLLKRKLKSEGYKSEKYVSAEDRMFKNLSYKGKKNKNTKSAPYASDDMTRIAKHSNSILTYDSDPIISEIWDDGRALSVPLSDSTTFKFKTFLMGIPRMTHVTQPSGPPKQKKVLNPLNQQDYYEYTNVFNIMVEELADFEGNVNERIAKLKESNNPVLIQLASMLEDVSNHSYNEVRNQFKSITDVQKHNFKTVKEFTRTYEEYGREITESEYRVINTNANSIRVSSRINALSYQIDRFEEGEGILETSQGQIVLSKEKFLANKAILKQIIIDISEFKPNARNSDIAASQTYMLEKKNKDKILKLFRDAGIKINENTYRDYVYNPAKYLKGIHSSIEGIASIDPVNMFLPTIKGYSVISHIYHKNIETMDFTSMYSGDSNPVKDRAVEVFLTNLAKSREDFSNSTHLNSKGDQVSDKGLPHYLSQKFKSIANSNPATFKEYADSNFSSTSRILEAMESNDYIRETLSAGILEAMSTGGKAVRERKESTDNEKIVSDISAFINNGKGKKSTNFMYFTPLVFSDKSRNIGIEWLKTNVNFGSVYYNKASGDMTDIKDMEVKDSIKRLLLGEIKRINKVRELRASGDNKNTDPLFLKNGGKFYLFPSVNTILQKYDASKPIVAAEIMDAAIAEVIKDISYEYKKLHDEIKVKKLDRKLLDTAHKKYKIKASKVTKSVDDYGIIQDEEKFLRNLVADYTINYMLGTAEFMQLLTDPAQLDKGKGDKAIWRDYYKRLAGTIGTGMEGSFEFFEGINGTNLDSNFNEIKYIFLEDMNTKRYLEKYNKVSEGLGDAYTDVSVTDAQEFTTLKEHIVSLMARGRIPQPIYDSINSKIISSYKTGNDIVLEEGELKSLFSIVPEKPLYYGDTYNNESESLDRLYVKSSSFPLIPQYTKGLEIDNLRRAMEKMEAGELLDDDGNYRKGNKRTVRAAFKTAVKVGSKHVNKVTVSKTVTDEAGNETTQEVINSEAFKDMKSVVVPRAGFRIQQEEGGGHNKEVLTVSQMNVLLMTAITELDGFRKYGSGKEVKKAKERLKKELMDIGSEKLAIELGLVDGKPVSVEAIRDVLQEELEGSGISFNELQALKLVDGALAIPLDMGFNANRVVSAINSKISQRVLRPKIRGKSYVQGSSFGVKKLSGVNKTNIFFTDKFKGELGYQEFDENGNPTDKMQVILPWIFEEDINDYLKTDENGNRVVDMDLIDTELLSIIGARIPNQGHSSMANMEIVGFLPEIMDDLIILPDEITKQMGSDYDVDHLFTYMYNYKKEQVGDKTHLKRITRKNAKKHELELAIQNEYVELHDIVLSHPTVVQAMLNPLDMNDMEDLAKDIRKEEVPEERFVPMGRSFVSKGYTAAQAGKIGVAIQANASVLLTQMQDLDMSINDSEGKPFSTTLEIDGEPVTFSSLGLGYYNNKEDVTRSNADFISMMLTESVDNANKGNLFYLGYDAVNSGVYNMLSFLIDKKENMIDNKSIPGTMIVKIMLQDSIKEITKELKEAKDLYGEKKDRADDIDIITKVVAKYRKGGSSIILSEELLSSKEVVPGTSAHNDINYTAAKLFLDVYNASTDLSIINSILKAETKGVGKDIPSILQKVNIYNNLIYDSRYVNGAEGLIIDPETGELTEVGHGIENSVLLAKRFWGSRVNNTIPMSIAASSSFDDMIATLGQINPGIGVKELKEASKTLHEGFKSYLATIQTPESDLFKDNGVPIDLKKFRREALFGYKSLPVRIAEYLRNPNNTAGHRFLSSLDIKRGGSKIIPSHVALNSFKLSTYDTDFLATSFNQLYNGDEYQRQLALDLIRYSILEGAQFSPLSLKKVIPVAILHELGWGKGLNKLEIESIDKIHVLQQVIQHNIELAADSTILGKLDRISEAVFQVEVTDDNENMLFVKEGPKLYKKISTLNKLAKYSRIPTYTNDTMSEYDASKPMHSTDGSTRSIFKETDEIAKFIQSQQTDIARGDILLEKYFTAGFVGKPALKAALSNVSLESNKHLKELVERLMPLISDDFEYEFKDIETRGHANISTFGTNTITINTKKFSNATDEEVDKTKEFEEVLLHEIVHLGMGNLTDIYTKSKSNTIEGNKAKKFLSPDIKIAMSNIEEIFEALVEEDREGVERFRRLADGRGLEGEHLTAHDRSIYEPLRNLQEFMVGITNPTFIEHYKDVPFKGKSFISKIRGYLDKLFGAMFKGLRQDSALYQGYKEYFKVLDLGLQEVQNKIEEQETRGVKEVTVNGRRILIYPKGGMTYKNGKPVMDFREKNLAAVKNEYKSSQKVTISKEDFYVLDDKRIIQITDNVNKNNKLMGVHKYSDESLVSMGMKEKIYEATGNTIRGKNKIETNDKEVNIYAGTGENTVLSNFAVRPFNVYKTKEFIVLLPNDYLFNYAFDTVEGAFQAAKATFSTMETGDLVDLFNKLATATGSKAKVIGKSIKNLNVKSWDNKSKDIMEELIYQSLTDNKKVSEHLLNTEEATLTHRQDKSKWGKQFPEVLMNVRNRIRNEQTVGTTQPVQGNLFESIGVYSPIDVELTNKTNDSNTKC